MKLRHTPRSPFVRKVLVLAHEHGLVDRIELVPTSLSPVQGNDTLALENPLMKVPSLVTDDGEVLFDSPVICEYLDDMRPAENSSRPPDRRDGRHCGNRPWATASPTR